MANKCGTNAGYMRHRRNGEKACLDCLKAHNLQTRFARPTNTRTTSKYEPIWHGTRSGYMRHRRRNEAPCDECVEAHRQACEAYNTLNKIG